MVVLCQGRQSTASRPGGVGSSRKQCRRRWRSVPLDRFGRLSIGVQGSLASTIAIGVRLVPSKLGFPKLIQVFAAGESVIGIVHGDVGLGLRVPARGLEVVAVAAFEDVHFGIVDLGIDVVVRRAVFGPEVLCATERIS